MLKKDQLFKDYGLVNYDSVEELINDLELDDQEAFELYRWIVEERMRILEALGLNDYDYRKSYDPITIEIDSDGNIIVHSYLFDFWDGRRHHFRDDLNIENYPTMAKLLGYLDKWVWKELIDDEKKFVRRLLHEFEEKHKEGKE